MVWAVRISCNSKDHIWSGSCRTTRAKSKVAFLEGWPGISWVVAKKRLAAQIVKVEIVEVVNGTHVVA